MKIQPYLHQLRDHSNRFLNIAMVIYLVMLLLANIRPLERAFIGTFSDKLLHLITYMTLTILVYRGLKFEFFIEKLLATLGIIGLLAALDELLQLFSSHRVADFEDWLYDMLGAVFALLIIMAYRFGRQLLNRNKE